MQPANSLIAGNPEGIRLHRSPSLFATIPAMMSIPGAFYGHQTASLMGCSDLGRGLEVAWMML